MHEHTGKIKGESSLSCDSTAKKGASVMLYSIPDYYKEFHCVAGACEDTCCAGWQIVVDPKSLQKYKRVQGDFKNQLQKGLNRKKKVFRQDQEKRCAFLNEVRCMSIWERTVCAKPVGFIPDMWKNLKVCGKSLCHFPARRLPGF